jgi:hypothetical protein
VLARARVTGAPVLGADDRADVGGDSGVLHGIRSIIDENSQLTIINRRER